MPLDDARSLLAALSEHGIVPKAVQDEARALRERFPRAPDLARELVRLGKLTPFQANEIIQGRAAGLVLGQYLILDRVGKGGMGAVYKARHRVLDRLVALKVIRAEYVNRPEAIDRFQRECRAAARLSHPNIILVHDAHQAGDVHFLAMEYLEGKDLDRIIKERGPLPIAEACDYARQAALGLQHAHECGLVHRDVKPANLMRTADGARVKVLDFGLARLRAEPGSAVAAASLTGVGAVMGTPDYLAPEQAGGDSSHADIRADVYSLGCTLYHLLAGEPPFPGATLREKFVGHLSREATPLDKRRPDVPAGLSDLVRRMMAKEPAARFQTPSAVAAALAPYCDGRPDAAPTPPVMASPLTATLGYIPKRAAGPRRLRWGIIAAAAVAFLSCTGFGFVAWRFIAPAPTIGRPTAAPDDRLVTDGDKEKTSKDKDPVKDKNPFKDKDPVKDPIRDPGPGVHPPIDLAPPKDHIHIKDGVVWPAAECVAVLGERRGRHWGEVKCVAVRPDGALIATCDRIGFQSVIHLWDADKLVERADWTAVEDYGVAALAFSPDGRTLAAVSGARVRLWEAGPDGLSKPRELPQFGSENIKGLANGVLFTPDGKKLLAWDQLGAVWRWDLSGAEPKPDGTLPAVTTAQFPLALSADGRWMAYGHVDAGTKKQQVTVVALFDKQAPEKMVECAEALKGVALSADGGLLAARVGGNPGGALRVWDLAKDEPEPRPDIDLTKARVRYMDATPFFRFSPDGRRIALPSIGDDGKSSTFLFDVKTGKTVELKGHVNTITGFAFDRDGRLAASCGEDHSLRLYDADKDGFTPRPMETATGPVRDVAFDPRGRLAAVSRLMEPRRNPGANNLAPGATSLVVWDLEKGKPRAAFDSPGWFYRCAFGAGGRLVACGGLAISPRPGVPGGTAFLRIWDPDLKEEVPPPALADKVHSGYLDALSLDRTGETLAVSGGSSSPPTAFLCDVHPFKVRDGSFKVESSDPLALSPDGTTAAAIVRKGTFQVVQFWDVKDRDAPKEIVSKRPLEYAEEVQARGLAYSPDGKTLGSIARIGRFEQVEKAVFLWDVDKAKGRSTEDKKGKHEKAVNAFAFSPDGKALATAGDDGRVVVWRADSLEVLEEVRFPGLVYALAFSGDGLMLATGDADGTVALLLLPALVPPPPPVK